MDYDVEELLVDIKGNPLVWAGGEKQPESPPPQPSHDGDDDGGETMQLRAYQSIGDCDGNGGGGELPPGPPAPGVPRPSDLSPGCPPGLSNKQRAYGN